MLTKQEVWTVAEITEDQKIKKVSFELLARGRQLADRLNVPLASVVMGSQIEEADLRRLIYGGADHVYRVREENLRYFIVENYAGVMKQLIQQYQPQVVIAGATTQGRTLMPYLSIQLNTGLTADCTALEIEQESQLLLQIRPAIGGNIMATIKTPEKKPQMATVRPNSIKPLRQDQERTGQITDFKIDPSLLDNRVKHLGYFYNEGEEIDLSTAETIISGGRGLKKKDHLQLVFDLARQLNGAVGASRLVVVWGWTSYPHRVGLGGRTVNPQAYLAIGISGAIQHLAGMKTADVIVAINQDAHAPIFQLADFGVVGDLFEVLPLLSKRLKERNNHEV